MLLQSIRRVNAIKEYTDKKYINYIGNYYDAENDILTSFIKKDNKIYAIGNNLDLEDGYFLQEVNTNNTNINEIINDWFNLPQENKIQYKMTEFECLNLL